MNEDECIEVLIDYLRRMLHDDDFAAHPHAYVLDRINELEAELS